MTKKQPYGVDNKCGKGRGCRVVELPWGDCGSGVFGATQFSVFGVRSVSNGGQPTWKVVRWDSEDDAREHSQAAG